VETTGLHPGWHHRVAEVAVVQLDLNGRVVGEWCTLVNPERDLGPQHIHGITAAEARRSPRFDEIAGDLFTRLAGNLIVGHNVSFDIRFLAAEFARLGMTVPLDDTISLCTMSLSSRYLTSTARSLAMCCAAAGIQLDNAHSALHDARATAALMAHFLQAAGRPEPWRNQWQAALRKWPGMPAPSGREVRRGKGTTRSHFLARLIDGLPRVPHPPRANEYLAVLDRALLDRHLSATEQDELVAVAQDLGLSRGDTHQLHRRYLLALAERAWADGLVTDVERHDLRQVTMLLALPEDEVDLALAATRVTTGRDTPVLGDFQLRSGDCVVFTGQMTLPREVWTERAIEAGLGVHNNVTKTTKLVVAADPDSLSGKAKKAHTYRIPVVAEHAFASFLAALRTQEAQ
jgi:DNA polymerase-3 subunit epsilon